MAELKRRMPMGAEMTEAGAHFRVWAPRRERVEVVIAGHATHLPPEGNGYHSGHASAVAGDLYTYRLDEAGEFPDPASRFQPEGPHGASQIIDPSQFAWSDAGWKGSPLRGAVMYEMHIGTFTPEGTFASAARELSRLAELGVNVVELMPVAEFPGRYGWGYDGVNLFAPSHLYGQPNDLRGFVDAAHAAGIGVILDVVYNHFGPDGNYTTQFSEHYFTTRYENEWGDAINFDGPLSDPVREFYIANARHWIDEYHLDGFRLDATQAIFDGSKSHIIGEISKAAREAARERSILIAAENEPQETALVTRWGVDSLWNDDFHHSAMVALTGRNEAYYTDYHGTPQEFLSAIKYGYLYQGQRYSWQEKRRGTPALKLKPENFVTFIQNHDQVANSARGWRVDKLTTAGRLRAMTALMLLAPPTPMLFQGQEFGASNPFLYFADHEPGLAALVRKGRHKFLEQFRSLELERNQSVVVDPASAAAFEQSILDLGERVSHRNIYEMHRDLLKLRREDAVVSQQGSHGVDGAVLAAEAFVLRWFAPDEMDRILVVNLGRDLHLDPAPEPLLAPPRGLVWSTLWSSENPCYGGQGTYSLESDENWRIPGHAAVLMKPGAEENIEE